MSRPKSKAKAQRPKRTHRTAPNTPKELQDTIDNAVKNLRVAQEELEHIGSYLFISMTALRAPADGDGALLIRDALRVIDDAYERLLLDASSRVDVVLDALDPDGSAKHRETEDP